MYNERNLSCGVFLLIWAPLLLTMWPWACCSASPRPSVPICEMGLSIHLAPPTCQTAQQQAWGTQHL